MRHQVGECTRGQSPCAHEQSHCEEIESLAADTQVRLANAIEEAANKPATQNNHFEYVDKKETNIGTNYGPNIENNGSLTLPNKDDK